MKRETTVQRRPGKVTCLFGCIGLALLLLFGTIWFTLRQSGSDGKLAEAVRQDDFPGVKEALTHGADANLRASRDGTSGWTGLIRLVLRENQDPVLWIAMERYQWNSMMGPPQPAKMQADAEIFEALLAAHADPNSCIDPRHKLNTDNLLYDAVNGQLTPIALSLLKHGAALPAEINREPPLEAAVLFANSPDVVQALLRAGADAKGQAGRQSLVVAYQQTWSFPAHRKDALAIFRMLLDAGADPNTTDANALPNGASLLYDAVEWKHFEVVPMLLRAHADPKLSPKNDLPLLYRALDCHPDIFQELLEAGADANTHESNGEPLLWYAVIHGLQEPEADKVRKVQLLLQHGADVHAKFPSYYGDLSVPEAAHRDARDGHIPELILDLLDQAVKAGVQ